MGSVINSAMNGVGGAVNQTIGSAVEAAAKAVETATSSGIGAAKATFEKIDISDLTKSLTSGLANPGSMPDPGAFYKGYEEAVKGAGKEAAKAASEVAGAVGALASATGKGLGKVASEVAGAVGAAASATSQAVGSGAAGAISELVQESGKLIQSGLKNMDQSLKDVLGQLDGSQLDQQNMQQVMELKAKLDSTLSNVLESSQRVQSEITSRLR